MPPASAPTGGPVKSAFVVMLLLSVPLSADVSLPALFSDHAVLQKAERVPIWGRAAVAEAVVVKLGSESRATVAAADGRWQVQFDLRRAQPGPQVLEVKAGNTITVNDVLVGEVWLASGQSNMAWTVQNTTGAKEAIARSANPALRHFRVASNAAASPASDVQGRWEIAGPATTEGFTAAGYFFAREVQRGLGVPVGLLHASWGGTPVEAWTSLDGLRGDPALKASTEKYQAYEQGFAAVLRNYEAAWSAWVARHSRQDEVAGAPGPDAAWMTIARPADAAAAVPAAGAVWWRKTLAILPAEAGLQQAVSIGPIDGFHVAYFNGEKIREVTPATGAAGSDTVYVKGDLIRAGTAEFSVRIFNPAGAPVIKGDRPLRFNGRPITGEWQAHIARTLPILGGEARAAMPRLPAQPLSRQSIGAYLYNGMIAPLVPFAIRGAIWYQGETNTARAWQYRTAFSLLIQDWRAKWGQGDFPFYFCQLANLGEKPVTPGENNWAELREAQSLALELPNTGQAVLIDIGEGGDVHARNKQDVGARLARLALARTYGRDVVASGPVYRGMAIEGGRIRLRFSELGGGLVARTLPESYQPRSTIERSVPLVRNSPGSELEGFAICGADGKWVWAQARIEGETVVVSSPQVAAPVAVRYAWAANPTCNLYNKAGLPAAPFRTDDFRLSTIQAKY